MIPIALALYAALLAAVLMSRRMTKLAWGLLPDNLAVMFARPCSDQLCNPTVIGYAVHVVLFTAVLMFTGDWFASKLSAFIPDMLEGTSAPAPAPASSRRK